MQYANVPEQLKAFPRWVTYKIEHKDGRKTKIPYNPNTGERAKAGQPQTWGRFEEAVSALNTGKYDGIGFEFHKDGFVGIDFDNCIENGVLNEWVSSWVARFNSYVEYSPSGTGVHIICEGELPGKAIKRPEAEMYDCGRFFTVTGKEYGLTRPLREAQEAINALYEEITPKKQNKPVQTSTTAVSLEDSKLLEIAEKAKNGSTFTKLYQGDWQGLYKSQSEADIALCNMLAFYTGKDHMQMDRLFRSSGLMRDKWDRKQNGTTYGAITIQNSIDCCTEVYNPRKSPQEVFNVSIGDDDKTKHVLDTIPAEVLQVKEIPDITFVVVDMIPQGLSLLASPPKYGKSWFVLDLCLSVAAGESFLNHQTVKKGCLYLALEDSERRLKDRMNKVLAGKRAPQNFDYAISALDIGNGLMEQLEHYMKSHKETGLIVIDTLQKVRSPSSGKENQYSADYRETACLKRFADRHNICLLLVHHLRKMSDDTDPFNRISGTNGIMGAVDTAMVLSREKREDTKTTLSITGRDIESSETILEFDKNQYKWCVMGDSATVRAQQAFQDYNNNPIVMTIKKLLMQSPAGWSGTMQDLLEAGKVLCNTYLDYTTRGLSSKVKSLDKQLYDYDNIIHSRVKHGTGGGKHKFYYNNYTVHIEQPKNISFQEPSNIN